VSALLDSLAAVTSPEANANVQRGLSVVVAGLFALVGSVAGRATGRRSIEAA